MALAPRADYLREVPPALTLHIYGDLHEIEPEWRRFERVADCTAFQTFDWLSLWHRHIGRREGARPAIVVGRFGDAETAFIVPLCVVPSPLARRLCWLGQELGDYNAPLLAPDFSERVDRDRFLSAWDDMQVQMQRDPMLRFDWIEFEKMPQQVGAQVNPFSHLHITPNASGAHLMHLGDDWETFYTAKRSSATRRRDRTKRRHLSEHGEIRFVTAADASDARGTVETLMEQKSRAFARKGIADIFARPGYREFFLDLVTDVNARRLVHVSRVDIGPCCAATNLGVVYGDCYYHVLASYRHGAFSHYGPGALHLRQLMAHAIGAGLKRFDFTIGDEPYKLEWCDTHIDLYDFAAAATWRGVPSLWSSTARRRIKRFIKQTPLAWRAVSSARAAVGALTHPLRRS